MIEPDEAMRRQIAEAIEDYNARRSAMAALVASNMWWYVGGAMLAALFVLAILVLVAGTVLAFEFYVWYLAGCLFLGWFAQRRAAKPGVEMQQQLRDRILPQIFGFIEGVRYDHEAEASFLELMPAEATGPYNRKHFDDRLIGAYGDMAFELSEMRLEYKPGKNTRIVFMGVIVNFRLATPFPGRLVATKPQGPVSRFFASLFTTSKLVKVESGDPRMDAIYDFRSDNAEAAAPLLSGNLVRALDALRGTMGGEPPRIAVDGREGFVLLPHGRNFFELPSLSVPLDYAAHVEPMAAELVMLLESARLVRSAFG